MIGFNSLQPQKCETRSFSQLESDLSFEQVCPLWFRKFSNGLDKLDLCILASDSKYCLVGEAWGFTGKQTGFYVAPLIPLVGCWRCIRFGQKFGKVAKKNDATAKDFEPLITKFLIHWNQKHKSITHRLNPIVKPK
ncbi:MAG TPA: hypothetical protein VH415_11605 [Nitrososphaeraceae archaeon]|jgi:hypothetical protein